MQHIDEPLKRYELTPNSDFTVVSMNEVSNGRYVKYEDVKKFLEIIAQKVRLI